MEKLELKYLKGYLGTGLKCYAMGEATEESTGTDDEKPQLFTIEGMNSTWIEVSGRLETVNDEINIEDCIPLLLPLSALTEPLKDGSVPIAELAKIAYPKDSNFELINGYVDLGLDYSFHFLKDAISFDCRKSYNGRRWDYNCYVPNQLQLFEYLYSKHFDIHGLIHAGLAIDKRTIK